MAKANSNGKQEILIKVNGKMEKFMVMGSINLRMEMSMRANGKMGHRLVKV